MTAPALPGLEGADDWPAVAVPGAGEVLVDGDQGAAAAVHEIPADGGTASPPVPETAGQTPGRRGLPADPIGSASPVHARRPPAGTGKETSAPGAPAAHDVCRSQRCRAKIRWAKTDSGDSIPVDYTPDPAGNLVRYMRAPGDWRVRVVKDGEVLDPSLTRWTSHFTTCPEATKFRRRDQPRPAAAAPSSPAVLEVAPAPGPGVLLVIDGPSIGHRAFHAYGPRDDTTPGMRHPKDGRPWWAVYGFAKLLVGLVEMVGPDAVLVGFDDRAGSGRRERYPDYKAGRGERSEHLHPQLDLLPDLCAELGVATMTPPALEADDVLASAAAAGEAAGWRVVVATSDKDAFRLITDRVSVLRIRDGLANAVTMTPAVLLEELGVTPAQYSDYAVLVGDTSDNLPGVDGIGPKRAVALLAACGTLDAAIADPTAAAAAIKGYAKRLTTPEGTAVIARNRDIMAPFAELPVDVEICRPRLTGGAIAKVLKAWHMPSLIDKATAVLGQPDVAGARLIPVAPASSAPLVPRLGTVAPTLEQAGAGQAEADRTCGECGEVCAARVPLAGDDQGATVLLTVEHLLGDVLMVPAGEGWAAQPIAGYVGHRDNRRRVHRCPVYAGRCVTPDHTDRPARLYPGGWFCDGCMAGRIDATRVVTSGDD